MEPNEPYHNEYGPRDNPLEGIDKVVSDALIERIVRFTCHKIACCRDRRDFAKIYLYLTSLPIKAVVRMPKPLLDEFWKFVDSICQQDPRDNAAHGLKAVLEGITAMLSAEDQFQQDFHGLELYDILEDYQAQMNDIAISLRKADDVAAEWARPAFRTVRKALPNPKGKLGLSDAPEAPDAN